MCSLSLVGLVQVNGPGRGGVGMGSSIYLRSTGVPGSSRRVLGRIVKRRTRQRKREREVGKWVKTTKV